MNHQSLLQKSLPPPEANAEAIHFLNSLRTTLDVLAHRKDLWGLEELQMLFFSETLVMVADTGEPQGELTVDVQMGKYKDQELGFLSHCLLVHAYSRGFINSTSCGNSLQGFLSLKLETLEQHSHEFLKFQTLPMERKTNLLKQGDQMAMTRIVKDGEEVKTEVTFSPWHSVAGFVSEAANLVLLRLMAWRQTVPSNARFLALDTEGKLCYSTYRALGVQTLQVGLQQVDVFIVEQSVHAQEGIPMSCQFYLLSDGHLAKRVQVGSPVCCVITKVPPLREEDEIEPPPVFGKKSLVWEEDSELCSRFLERKEELRLSHARYLQQHPEARALVADFLLFVLLRQPADAVTFAAEYFGAFARRPPPAAPLRASGRPSPFRPRRPER